MTLQNLTSLEGKFAILSAKNSVILASVILAHEKLPAYGQINEKLEN